MAAPSSSVNQVTLKILVDENKNKVVYAEAGKDFVDVLLSFLTFPLGTIVRIVSNDSNMPKVSVGSLSSLYESVANLDVKHFWSETCKEMLLHPKNSSEDYCQTIKLNIDDTEKTKYFICQDPKCSRKESCVLLSTFKNKICKCGKFMCREILTENSLLVNGEGFVNDVSTFTIFDDLKMIPDNVRRSISELSLMEDVSAMKIVTVSVSQKEIVELLRISLLSNTPLTDFFLRREVFFQNIPKCRNAVVFDSVEAAQCEGQMFIGLRIVRTKSNNKILFALAEDDFINILLSFLTFPLGGVEDMLKGHSFLGSIDNLYTSIVGLDSYKFLKSLNLKDKLVKSPLPPLFKLRNPFFPIYEVPVVNYSCCTENVKFINPNMYLTTAQSYRKTGDTIFSNPMVYVNPQSSTTYNSPITESGFVKKPFLYMVSDDLVVKPGSSMSVVSFLTVSGFSSSELDEQIIKIGKTECLNLLKASLISSTALTDVFG